MTTSTNDNFVDRNYALHIAETVEGNLEAAAECLAAAWQELRTYRDDDCAYILPNATLLEYLTSHGVPGLISRVRIAADAIDCNFRHLNPTPVPNPAA